MFVQPLVHINIKGNINARYYRSIVKGSTYGLRIPLTEAKKAFPCHDVVVALSLQWRHNERDGVSNNQHHRCLLNRFFQTQIKENTKATRHWPLWGEFTEDRWIPRTKGQWRGKCFHLMTSPCYGCGQKNGPLCVRPDRHRLFNV